MWVVSDATLRRSRSQVFPVSLALVATPEPAVFAAYAGMLHDVASTFEHARDGRDARVYALRQPPNLIVADAELPYISGYALRSELLRDSITNATAFVIITADPVAYTPSRRATDFGGTAVLSMPVLSEPLIAAARDAIFRSQQIRERGNAAIAKAAVHQERSRSLLE